MRCFWWTLGLLMAGCRRDSCEPRVVADDPLDEERVASVADVFMSQLRPDLGLCVPVLDVRSGASGEEVDPESRRVDVGSTAQAAVHRLMGEALASQNEALLEGQPWATMPEPRAAFGEAAAVMAVEGALLTSSCPEDEEVVSTLRVAGEVFVASDFVPGNDYYGVRAEPGRYEEMMRVSGEVWLGATPNALYLVADSSEPVAWVTFNGDVESWQTVYLGPISVRALDEYEGVGVRSAPDGSWRRRVFRNANTVRLLGDGCVRPGGDLRVV